MGKRSISTVSKVNESTHGKCNISSESTKTFKSSYKYVIRSLK